MNSTPTRTAPGTGTASGTDTDVIVVGAGPTGLALAAELRLGGARVVVLEKLAEPTGQSRGLGFTTRAMELFDSRGLLPRFGTLETAPRGHFGGVQFDYSTLRDAHFGARGIPQSRVERVLEEWAVELGADVRRGWDVLDVLDAADDRAAHSAGEGADEGAVTVTVTGPEGERRLRARFLVGCDGARSTVRRRAGFDFPGTPATRAMYLADVAGCGIRPRFLGERLPQGMVMAAPLAEGLDRIIVCEHGVPADKHAEQPRFEEVADAWQRITGESIRHGTAEWVSSFTDATRQATQYRRGRVLLAGDAAHIHLPAGGQGLSTGVQDAFNLGWKLAAEVRGWAPPGLLDSYHDERHPVGARLLMNTRAQGAIFLGGAEADPLRQLLEVLIGHDDVKRLLAGIVSGINVSYGDGGDPRAHPLVGRRVPPRTLTGPAGPTTPARLLHKARGVLLDLTGAAGGESARTAEPWADRVTAVAATPEEPEGFEGARVLLVRPDGYVAWAAERVPADLAGLAAALHRTFGEPSHGPTAGTQPERVTTGRTR